MSLEPSHLGAGLLETREPTGMAVVLQEVGGNVDVHLPLLSPAGNQVSYW